MSKLSLLITQPSHGDNVGSVRLQGRWLLTARVVWTALVVSAFALFVISLPAFYQRLQVPCIGAAACQLDGALTPAGMHTLQVFGFSPSGYAAYTIVLNIVLVVVWSAIGFVLFWRRSDEWMALLVALMLILFNMVTQDAAPTALMLAQPVWTIPVLTMNFLSELSFALFFYLFPDGRFVPQWMRWLALFFTLVIALQAFPPLDSPLNAALWPQWVRGVEFFCIFLSVIFSQIYRYRRMTTPRQRQQVKWAISGIVFSLIAVLVVNLFTGFANTAQPGSIYELAVETLFSLIILPIPLSLAFAILRYRLWDIDIIINRTLVYGTLTAILALVYFGLIFALQFLLRGIINQNNDVAIVVSTLAIAALFQPLRRRIQSIIDRRFYRRKYDAAKTLEAFSATLRNEVDLNQLREQLITVVQDTMQPAHVSLWLRKPEREVKR